MAGEANVSLIKQSFDSDVALGERATQADFKVVIDGLEEFAPLIRTAQMPEMGRGEGLEDTGRHGQVIHQWGSPKRNGQIVISAVELKDGRLKSALWKLINEKAKISMRILDEGEGYSNKGMKLSHCLLAVDAGDLDTAGATAALLRNINVTYSWSEEI